jgi:hypothetical protein
MFVTASHLHVEGCPDAALKNRAGSTATDSRTTRAWGLDVLRWLKRTCCGAVHELAP